VYDIHTLCWIAAASGVVSGGQGGVQNLPNAQTPYPLFESLINLDRSGSHYRFDVPSL
jgi:hypothetical protein